MTPEKSSCDSVPENMLESRIDELIEAGGMFCTAILTFEPSTGGEGGLLAASTRFWVRITRIRGHFKIMWRLQKKSVCWSEAAYSVRSRKTLRNPRPYPPIPQPLRTEFAAFDTNCRRIGCGCSG